MNRRTSTLLLLLLVGAGAWLIWRERAAAAGEPGRSGATGAASLADTLGGFAAGLSSLGRDLVASLGGEGGGASGQVAKAPGSAPSGSGIIRAPTSIFHPVNPTGGHPTPGGLVTSDTLLDIVFRDIQRPDFVLAPTPVIANPGSADSYPVVIGRGGGRCSSVQGKCIQK